MLWLWRWYHGSIIAMIAIMAIADGVLGHYFYDRFYVYGNYRCTSACVYHRLSVVAIAVATLVAVAMAVTISDATTGAVVIAIAVAKAMTLAIVCVVAIAVAIPGDLNATSRRFPGGGAGAS